MQFDVFALFCWRIGGSQLTPIYQISLRRRKGLYIKRPKGGPVSVLYESSAAGNIIRNTLCQACLDMGTPKYFAARGIESKIELGVSYQMIDAKSSKR